MERRDFIIKSSLAVAAATVAPKFAFASNELPYDPQASSVGGDFQISSDTVKDGVRYVTAVPSAKVCSNKIDIEIEVKTKTIRRCEFTRGCPGNALGLCSLIKGMTTAQVIKTLKGTPCASRGTSCPDQLARILESLK